MKHKLFLLLAALGMMVPQVASAYDFYVGGIYYNKSGSNATVTYKTTSYNSYSGSVVIPSTVTYSGITYSVTSIGSSAFENCSGLTSVTIPNSIKNIGYCAFRRCVNLTKVSIPNSVEILAEGAFSRCSGLTSVDISNSVIMIGNYAFDYCSNLTSITIPNSVTSIGASAFENCSGLTSITIPNSVESIGNSAFYGCSGLTSVTIGNSVESIGDRAFSACSSLTSITIPNKVTTIGTSAFEACSALTSVTIGSGVESIGDYAFESCSGLTSIIVESGNTVFDSRENCNAIIETSSNTLLFGCQNTVIPESVTSIRYNAFKGFNTLTSIIIPSSVTSIGTSAFSGCSGLTSITIPSSVTSIGSHTFYNCSGLTSVTIPSNVESIGTSAFSGCSGLTSITIPSSVTSIGTSAFSNCSGLTSVTIPSNVESIGTSAFSGCSGLTSITIPNSVTSIGSYAFNGCSSLMSVICLATTPPTIGSSVFSMYGTLHVLEGLKEIYALQNYWKNFTIVEDADGILPLDIKLYNLIFVAETEYNTNNYDTDGLITEASQFSSPFSQNDFGYKDGGNLSDGVLIDGDSSTYWHTVWTEGSVSNHTHYLQVALEEPISGSVQLSMTRRKGSSDHITLIGVWASNEPDGEYVEIGSVVTPYSNSTETKKGTFILLQPYQYLRFYIDETTSNCGYGHMSEFQLYCNGGLNAQSPAVANILAEAIALAKTVEEATEEDISALQEALDFYRANINRDYNVFTDGITYSNSEETQAEVLAYTRNFKNTEWQALYIPFSLDYEEWCDDFDIAKIHNFVEYDDDENGEFDRTYLVVLKKNSGSTKANYPYLIRAKETGVKTLTLVNKTLEPAEINSVECGSTVNIYTFTGSYTPVTDMYANGYYALSGGALNKANSASVVLGAQRWYMDITPRATEYGSGTKAQSIKIVVDGEDETEGIKIPSSSSKGESPVAYDLMGRGVKGAVKGISIVNGKKIIN